MISFNSVGHFFAKAFKAIANAIPKVESTQPVADAITAAVDPAVRPLVDAGYAVLGEVASLLAAGESAAEQKLADAGLDLNVIAMVKKVMADVPGIVAVAKKL